MAAEKTQSGAFQDSHTSTHDKEYAYKEEVFELSRDRAAAKKTLRRPPCLLKRKIPVIQNSL